MSTDTAAPESAITFDLDAAWRLHPQVSIRPERFGALLYHFGTRRLSFVKHPQLLDVLRSLSAARSAGCALDAVGVAISDRAAYTSALRTLAGSSMICLRDAA